jgi:hypothetical protein
MWMANIGMRRHSFQNMRSRFPAAVFSALALAWSATDARSAAISIALTQLPRTANNGALGTIDLTAGGTALDWLKPVNADLSFAEKDLANLLSFSQVGAGTLALYGDDGYNFSYSGGDSNSLSGSLFTGSRVSPTTAGSGFRLTLTVPVAGDFTVNFYSAANQPLRFTLTGTVGAATDSETPPSAQTGNGVDELFWTVTGTTDTAGQVVTLDLVSNLSGNVGALAITGANVTSVPEPGAAALLAGAFGSLAGLRRRRPAN